MDPRRAETPQVRILQEEHPRSDRSLPGSAGSKRSSGSPPLTAIIYWQICEIQRVIEEADEEELDRLRLDLLSHVSPAFGGET